MGSGGSKSTKTNDDRDHHPEVKREVSPEESKEEEIKVEDYQTMDDLAHALTDGLTNDVQRVRAVFTWIGLQGASKIKSKIDNRNQDVISPHIIVQQVAQRKLSYNFLFMSLCRAAKIPCVRIRGLGKSVSYEVGDKNVDNLNNSWTAVFVAGGWHFVFPLWAFSAVVGHSKGTWTLVESQGEGAREKEEKSSGQTISQINDYYFLTHAEDFIYNCYPLDKKWQLLAKPFTKQDFIDIAYCTQDYFEDQHKITTPAKCVYTSVRGVCEIGIKKLDKEESSYVYKLYFNHEESGTTLSSEIQLERYVAIFNEGHSMRFRVRFPSEGIYKMEIFGDYLLLCAFKLECNEDVNYVKPFPCNPESGFGPNSQTEEAGLKAQSHKTGFINIKQTKNFNMTFNVTKNVLVQTILIHDNVEQETLTKHVNHKIKGQELDINVNLPQKGEYALQINTKDKDSGGSFVNACNYLLTSENINKSGNFLQNAIEKRARKALQEKAHSNDIETLQKVLDDFDKVDLEDKGDRHKVEERLTYLNLRKELIDAIARRHGEKLKEAIENAKSSEYEANLKFLIEEAEDLLGQLQRLKGFAHDILKMQQTTISEIHNYKRPKPMAYDVMKATYILLGEEERHVQEWEQIQTLMRRTGKEGLLRRIRQFDIVHVTENMINHSSQILRPYDEERIRVSSAGLATFYKWVDLEDTLEGYPPPKPNFKRKEQIFTEHDKTAADAKAEQIEVEDYQSLDDLAHALTDGLTNDVQKVRAIFTWIGLQGSMENTSEEDGNENQVVTSPKAIVLQVTQRELSYNYLFISLCRAVKIPCVLIRGVGKSVSYEVGDKNVDNLKNSWTAVYVSGGWHFVFPLWAFSAVVGHSKGTWTLVETEGKGVREKEERSSGQTILYINDYYFLTEAEEFIYNCYPEDSKWQLLTRPFTKQEFIEIACCTQGFFENNYKITTPNKCLYRSVRGVCEIGIKKLDKEESFYAYNLYFNHEESDKTLSTEIQLERYVALFNEGSSIRFRVRFPSEGVYKLEIFGDGSRLCEFRLECNEDVNYVKPFPYNPESGFGPNSLTEDAGLRALSHKTGFIDIKQTMNFNVIFNITKKVLVQTILIHDNMEQETKHVTHKIKGQELDISVNLPQKGEYALQINAKDKNSGGSFKNACNYLLTSENINKKRKPYENPIEKRIRKALQDVTSSNNLEALQKALDDFDKIDLEDKGDRQRAEERLAYLILRKELKNAIARRNGEKLEEAIENAKSSEYESDLENLIEEAEDLLSQLQKLKVFAHDILQMKQTTVSEIQTYKHPKPLAYDVMKATYILLGEDERQLEEWEQIQALMRKTGKEGLLRRVRQFNTTQVTKTMMQQSSQILRLYDEETIRDSSAGLGTFYKWASNVIEEMTTSKDSSGD
ncbi:uncharacterized protein LOC133178144 [Saccostrea echinata]|uniref:uncharacterized protein LOC133178144 n=1 Tax=Saccostrea echinata TaxID=191078 RepID=UPI002A8347A5|nr:uncharacterized protein LOC133178144 [Saccostrea echinata]